MNTDIMWEHGSTALNNCAFVSTKDIDLNSSAPFTFAMDVSMLGVGVGFDTKGEDSIEICFPDTEYKEPFIIEDTRESWVESLGRLLDTFFLGKPVPEFDYSKIRPAGELIKGFGGVASGPAPLKQLHENVIEVLTPLIGDNITSRAIVDIMNLMGCCVVAGNVRRCLPENAMIKTTEGMKKIKNIKVGDKVFTLGKKAKVLAKENTGEKTLVKITHKFGEFSCTPEHKVATKETPDSNFSFIKAKNLKEGMNLVFDTSILELENQPLPILQEKLPFNAQKFIIPKIVNTGIAWLTGYYQGDGSSSCNEFSITAECPKYEKLLLKSKKILEDNFHFENVKIGNHTNAECKRLRLHSASFCRWIDKNIKKSKEPIHIPDFITNSSKEVRVSYLVGLLEAAGQIKKDNIVILASTIYESLKIDLEGLLCSLGIGYSVSKDTSNITRYIIAIKGYESALKFNKLAKKYIVCKTLPTITNKTKGFSYSKKCVKAPVSGSAKNVTTQLLGRGEYIAQPSKVISVVKINLENTYDIEVEDLNYFTHNNIVMHNSALLALGDPEDLHYLDLKDYSINPERAAYGWSSNNSIEAYNGLDYKECAKRTELNGEPGYIFLENARKYGRIQSTEADYKDAKVEGFNPCSEQSLESFELCNLVEIALNNIKSKEEFYKVAKYAYLYAKTVTLLPTHIPETNRIMMRNRRIGTSLTGIVQYKTKHGINGLKELCEGGYDLIKYYDNIYSDWFCIPKSIKVTTVKPSGTVSLLTGSTPGVHYPKDRYYIRRMRLAKSSDLVQPLKDSGYKIEEDVNQRDTTLVVEFPIFIGNEIRIESDVSIWEQVELVAFMQQYWADNAVSNTITFDPIKEGKDIEHILEFYQYRCKSLSFLPANTTYYPQLPYETCTKDYYENAVSKLTPLNLEKTSEKAIGEKFCDTDSCSM